MPTRSRSPSAWSSPGEPPDAAGDPRASAAEVSCTVAPAGRRVLVIEPRDGCRVQAHALLRQAGVHVDAVSSIAQARAALADSRVDLVVTGIGCDEGACATLLDELRAARPGLRVIELVDDDAAFSLSITGSDRPARLGRHDIDRTLARAVAQELDGG